MWSGVLEAAWNRLPRVGKLLTTAAAVGRRELVCRAHRVQRTVSGVWWRRGWGLRVGTDMRLIAELSATISGVSQHRAVELRRTSTVDRNASTPSYSNIPTTVNSNISGLLFDGRRKGDK